MRCSCLLRTLPPADAAAHAAGHDDVLAACLSNCGERSCLGRSWLASGAQRTLFGALGVLGPASPPAHASARACRRFFGRPLPPLARRPAWSGQLLACRKAGDRCLTHACAPGSAWSPSRWAQPQARLRAETSVAEAQSRENSATRETANNAFMPGSLSAAARGGSFVVHQELQELAQAAIACRKKNEAVGFRPGGAALAEERLHIMQDRVVMRLCVGRRLGRRHGAEQALQTRRGAKRSSSQAHCKSSSCGSSTRKPCSCSWSSLAHAATNCGAPMGVPSATRRISTAEETASRDWASVRNSPGRSCWEAATNTAWCARANRTGANGPAHSHRLEECGGRRRHRPTTSTLIATRRGHEQRVHAMASLNPRVVEEGRTPSHKRNATTVAAGSSSVAARSKAARQSVPARPCGTAWWLHRLLRRQGPAMLK